DSIHGAGVMMLASRTASCQKWPPAPSVFPLQSGKSRSQAAFCKRLKYVAILSKSQHIQSTACRHSIKLQRQA
ncbi:MAG: hypothetical protein L6Q55_04235, partial [Azonexus sp.]